MDSVKLGEEIRGIVSTIAFSWTSTKPSYLEAIHRLAMQNSLTTAHINAPFDTPVIDLVTGTEIRPSVMQQHLLDKVIPSVLPSIQAIAEDLLNDHFNDTKGIFSRIEDLVLSNEIDRQLASRAHYWRMARNILAHGGGVVSERIEREAMELRSANKTQFEKFVFWGPLLDAGHRDIPDYVPVPIIRAAVEDPQNPRGSCPEVEILNGNKIEIGLADLLAATEVWVEVIHKVTGR